MLLVSLISETLEALAADARKAFARGADAVEVRADFLHDPAPQPARKALEGTAIYTLRPERGGGKWSGSERERLALLQEAGKVGFEFVDVEEDAGLHPDAIETSCILSLHDFSGIPGDLEEILARQVSRKPFLVKAVCRTDTLAEELRLVALQKRFGAPVACFGMGGASLVSRVLGRKFGAPVVYGALERGAEAAPGQVDVATLQKTYRIQTVGPQTKVFGLTGRPLGHSLSPAFHNRAFWKAGIDAVYLPFEVEAFDTLWNARDLLALEGLSVTIPHKEAALEKADAARAPAPEAGCANTLSREAGRWIADNTDVLGVREALSASEVSLTGAEVLLLGAGGAARAVVQAVTSAGGRVTVAGRTPERAKALASRFGGSILPFPVPDPSPFDVVVNATPLGMRPHEESSPLDPSSLRPGQTVFDLVYNPEETALLKAARHRGCRIVGGMAMFLAQAKAQQAIWRAAAGPAGG
jgi:3-dehydroquinate dehydratase/shikimate dehydrogenase